MKISSRSFTAKSLQLAVTAFTLLIVGGYSVALAEELAENAETCARLSSLVTVSDVEKLIDRKPVIIKSAIATSFGDCKMDIEIPGAQTLAGGPVGIVLRLSQHDSPQHALKSVEATLKFNDLSMIKELAHDPRGLAVQSKNTKNHYAMVGIDATVLTVTVFDASLDGPKVTGSLGEVMFKRALASDAFSQISAALEDVAIYRSFRPMFAMMERCKKTDIPSHTTMLKMLDSSPLKKAAVPAVTTMSPYAQRWLVANGIEKIVNEQLKRIADAPRDVLAAECEKLSASLPELEKNLPDKILKALKKAAN
jgi:hypothetical protein